MEKSIHSAKIRLRADCGSDHELLIAKFTLKLKKVGKITRPCGYDLNQIPDNYHTKWSKSDRERQIYDIVYIQSLKNDTNEFIHKTETDSQTQKMNLCIICLAWQCPHGSGPGSSLHLNAWTLCWQTSHCPTHVLGLDQWRTFISPLTEVICFNSRESRTLAMWNLKQKTWSSSFPQPYTCQVSRTPTTRHS